MSTAAPKPRTISEFTGRAWVLNALQKWLDSSTQRVFLITGAQGSGKSTMATRIAQISKGDAPPASNRIGKGFLTYAHFCRGDSDQTTLLPHRFVETLSGAIMEQHKSAREYLTEHLGSQQHITLSPSATVSGTMQSGSTLKNLEILATELAGDVVTWARDWLILDVSDKEAEKPSAAAFVGAWIDQIETTPDGSHIVVGDRQGYVRTFQYVPG